MEGGGECNFLSWSLGGFCCHEKEIGEGRKGRHIYFGGETGLIGNEILYRNVTFRGIPNASLPKLIFGG